MSPGFKSSMGKKKIEDFPGCGPFCSICIIPFHAGRGDFNGQEIFQRRSRLEVSSSDEMSGSPLKQCVDKPFQSDLVMKTAM